MFPNTSAPHPPPNSVAQGPLCLIFLCGLTSRLEGSEHPSPSVLLLHPPHPRQNPAAPWSPLGASWVLPGATACSCQALPCSSASGPVSSLWVGPTPRRSQPQALFFVFQAQSHIPSQQPALPSHPLIHGNWEGLPRAVSLRRPAPEGWWVEILVPSLRHPRLRPNQLSPAPNGWARLQVFSTPTHSNHL